MEYFSVQQIRKVYSVLSMLTYGSEEDTCELHDELASVIRKQLHHSDPKLVTSKIDIYLTFIISLVTLLVCNIACTYIVHVQVHVHCTCKL